jgi:two-component system sensor histidine kinase RegB
MRAMASPSDPQSVRLANLRRLLLVRVVMFAGLALAALYALDVLHMLLLTEWIVVILATMALFSIATGVRLFKATYIYEIELFGHLLADVLALAALLFVTGGATNPFVTLFLLPLALAAVALRPVYAWAIAFSATLAYSALLVYYVPLPHGAAGQAHDFTLHVTGMWIGFVVSAGLIAFFAGRIGASLRERDRLLAAMRERELKEEQVLALGTLATGAAHELGTPLSTLAVIAKDLVPAAPLPAARLQLLRSQIDRCREILSSLTTAAGAMRAEGGRREPIDRWVRSLLDDWQASRPGVVCTVALSGAAPAPEVIVDRTLTQAIVNLLNNAADASPGAVEVSAQWDAAQLLLEIADRGSGLDPRVAEHVGQPFLSTKGQEGLGLGLFLSYATLSRLGGEVTLTNREGGGVLCRVRLPLHTIG